jgi:hypothetical protein
LDVLNYWRKTGIGGDKIEGYVELGVADLTQAKLAIQHFGSIDIGLALPDENTFGPWTEVTGQPNPYNGHAVTLLAYDDDRKMFKVATWGEIWDMSYDWYQKYCDEAYAVLNDIQLIKETGKSPEGFDWKSLQYDLNHLGDPIVEPTPDPIIVDPPKPDPDPVPTPNPQPTPEPKKNNVWIIITLGVIVGLVILATLIF